MVLNLKHHQVVDNTKHPEHLLLQLPCTQNCIEQAPVNENLKVLSYCRHLSENFPIFEDVFNPGFVCVFPFP